MQIEYIVELSKNKDELRQFLKYLAFENYDVLAALTRDILEDLERMQVSPSVIFFILGCDLYSIIRFAYLKENVQENELERLFLFYGYLAQLNSIFKNKLFLYRVSGECRTVLLKDRRTYKIIGRVDDLKDLEELCNKYADSE